MDRKSRAMILYYIVKVIKKFEDYKFLTHQIYGMLEAEINQNIELLKEKDDIEIKESIVRLSRALYSIDFLI